MQRGWKTVVVMGAVLLGACNDEPAGTERIVPGLIVGMWVVESLDGQQLPATRTQVVQGTSCAITVRAMAVTFLSNRQFSRTQTLGVNCEGHAPFDDTSTGYGTYTVEGQTLTVTERDYPEDPEVSTFTIEEPRLTLTSATEDGGSSVLVARRR